MDNTPFVIKYEPKTIDDMLWWSEDAKRDVEAFTIGKMMDNIFLYGPPGTGKTLLARLLPEAILEQKFRPDCVIDLTALTTAARRSAMDELVKKMKFGILPGINPDRRFAVINEVGELPSSQIENIKNVLDWLNRLTLPTFLITTTNEQIPDFRIKRRGISILMDYPSDNQLMQFGRTICTEENVSLSDQEIADCVLFSQGSIALFLKRLELRVRRTRCAGAAKPVKQHSSPNVKKPGEHRKTEPFSLAKAAEEGQASSAAE